MQVPDLASEPLLVQRAKAGDREAFSALVRMHQAVVRAYMGSHVRGNEAADDLAQEVFVRAYMRLDSFEMPESGKTRPWLLGIARNLVLEHLRDQVRRGTRQSASGTMEAALDLVHFEDARDRDDPIDREMRFEALRRCLDKLGPPALELVSSHYFEQRSLASLAAEQNQKESAVRMKLFRIREALRSCIEHGRALQGTRA